MDEMFLKKTLPIPDLNATAVFAVNIGSDTIEGIDSFKRGSGNPSKQNFKHYFLIKDKPSSLGIWKHSREVP